MTVSEYTIQKFGVGKMQVFREKKLTNCIYLAKNTYFVKYHYILSQVLSRASEEMCAHILIDTKI